MQHFVLEKDGLSIADIGFGDCTLGMDRLESSVDVVVTSPPYNVGTEYVDYVDKQDWGDYLDWSAQWIKRVAKRLTEDGSFFLNVGATPSRQTIPFAALQMALVHFKLQNTFIWIKSVAVEKEGSEEVYGHYQPINSARYVNSAHEYVFHLTKTGDVSLDRLSIGVPYKDATNVARWQKGSHLHCRGSTWFIPYETVQKREGVTSYPATFPVRLPELCLKLHGADKIKAVLDPFCGSGSTGVACARMGAPFVGFDTSRVACEISKARIAEAVGESPESFQVVVV